MFITNETTITDVEGHPFIGITKFPCFLHIGLEETSDNSGVPLYCPKTFKLIKSLKSVTKTLEIKTFRGNPNQSLSNSIYNKEMIYFLPTELDKIIHEDIFGEYVRITTVKLSDHDFNTKNDALSKFFDNKLFENNIVIENDYKYLLIR